MKKLISNR